MVALAPIKPELDAFYQNFHSSQPAELTAPIQNTTKEFVASWDPSKTIQVGEKMPSFSMPSANGETVTSDELLAKGPILINFYRGSWCPFCNIMLKGYQDRLEQINAKGVTLVAITPELPDGTLSTAEKHALKFQVLSDVDNVFATKLRILHQQKEEFRPVFGALQFDLTKGYGNEKMMLPVPATLLVDQTGTIRNAFIDPDFVHRLEPDTALEWIDAL